MLQSITHRHFYYTGLHALIWLLLFSKAGISITIGYLALLSIVRIQSARPIKLIINSAAFSKHTYTHTSLLYYSFIGLFCITLLSGLNSEDIAGWFHFVKLKAPYLILPLVFMNHRTLARKIYHQLYISLIGVLCVSSVMVLANYFLDWESVTKSIGIGKAIATPLSHVKFSVLCAIASIASFILADKENFGNWLLYVFSIFLAVVIHVLAVRSGLVILYVVGGILLIHRFWSNRNYIMIGWTIFGGISIPLIAYVTIPSVYHKVHYMKYDLKMIQEGNTANYSDGERVRSLQIGIEIIKKNLYFGVGIGDIRKTCDAYYKDWFPDSQKRILPHNQYILVWASCGIFALSIFIMCLVFPILKTSIKTDILLVSLILTIVIYGLVEKPLDEYVFITVHALLGCCGISALRK